MSHAESSLAARRSGPLATWAGPAIVALAVLIGAIIAVSIGGLNWVYTVLFLVGALAGTALVNLRGLFLTVASIPAVFGVGTFLAGWGLATGSSKAGAFATTTLLTGIYPLIERFPSLLIAFLAAALLATVRLWLGRRRAQSTQERETATRRATAEADRRNRAAASKARERSGQLTVAELAARNSAPGSRSRERDREARRREQAAERAARERIEAGLPARDALEREQAERIARARHAAQQLAAAKQAAAADDPVRPDPNRRAGDQPYNAPTAVPRAAADAATDSPSAGESGYVGKRRRLDEDLYGED